MCLEFTAGAINTGNAVLMNRLSGEQRCAVRRRSCTALVMAQRMQGTLLPWQREKVSVWNACLLAGSLKEQGLISASSVL